MALRKRSRAEQLERLSALCRANASALLEALTYCAAHQIGSFRILSQVLPLRTHPEVGYRVEDLPESRAIVASFRACGAFARANGIRTGLHPDQFVVLNSPDPEVVRRSVEDLDAQAEIAEWTQADTLNIHGGGAYGDKTKALGDLRKAIACLPRRVRSRLTLENDDRTYTPSDLLPVCRDLGVPLVYDVHHHRVCPDALSIAEATAAARSTWDREPLFHLSSPKEGWKGPGPERHHDYIDARDFPDEWRGFDVTVEVEAKAKEKAVLRLANDLR
jgi:UV DNA damage endonuclease